MQKNSDQNEPTDQDFDYLKEALKCENLNCDYYHNLVTNSKIEKVYFCLIKIKIKTAIVFFSSFLKLIEDYLSESLAKKLNKNAYQNVFYICKIINFLNTHIHTIYKKLLLEKVSNSHFLIRLFVRYMCVLLHFMIKKFYRYF